MFTKSTVFAAKERKKLFRNTQAVRRGGSNAASISSTFTAREEPLCGHRLQIFPTLYPHGRARSCFHARQNGVWASKAFQPSIHIDDCHLQALANTQREYVVQVGKRCSCGVGRKHFSPSRACFPLQKIPHALRGCAIIGACGNKRRSL